MSLKEEFSPLQYDPFEGDFGDQGDRVFSDALVNARKQHICSHCCGPIALGEQYRRRREKSDGEMRTWKWCAACCIAMVEEMRNEYLDEDEDEPEDEFPFVTRCRLHETGNVATN